VVDRRTKSLTPAESTWRVRPGHFIRDGSRRTRFSQGGRGNASSFSRSTRPLWNSGRRAPAYNGGCGKHTLSRGRSALRLQLVDVGSLAQPASSRHKRKLASPRLHDGAHALNANAVLLLSAYMQHCWAAGHSCADLQASRRPRSAEQVAAGTQRASFASAQHTFPSSQSASLTHCALKSQLGPPPLPAAAAVAAVRDLQLRSAMIGLGVDTQHCSLSR
jgi:hypothetical protein